MNDEENVKTDMCDGQVTLKGDNDGNAIKLITIIGEIEGHDILPATSKTTKYEHILPQLAAIENDDSISGVLFLMNTKVLVLGFVIKHKAKSVNTARFHMSRNTGI